MPFKKDKADPERVWIFKEIKDSPETTDEIDEICEHLRDNIVREVMFEMGTEDVYTELQKRHVQDFSSIARVSVTNFDLRKISGCFSKHSVCMTNYEYPTDLYLKDISLFIESLPLSVSVIYIGFYKIKHGKDIIKFFEETNFPISVEKLHLSIGYTKECDITVFGKNIPGCFTKEVDEVLEKIPGPRTVEINFNSRIHYCLKR